MAQMNLSTKQKQTHRHRDQTCGWQGGGRGMDWEFAVGRCKLLHVGWMEKKVLLYNIGNYVQCPGINNNGKEYKKEYIYIYIYIYIYKTESLCCTPETNTRL